MTSALGTRRKWRWAAAAAGAAAVLAVGVPFLYTNFVADDAPAPLVGADGPSAAAPAATATTGAGAAAGTGDDSGRWQVTTGSQAGYRVKEILLGQDTEAVGRTSSVSGQATVEGGRVTAGTFTVDLTTVQSDQDRRDAQFHRRIMDTATYPTASFKLGRPIDVAAVAAGGAGGTVKATGDLTLHGTTRPVTVDLSVKRTGDTIRVGGSIPVTFADWNIPNPSFGPVSTDDHGQIEFLLVLAHA